MGKLAFCIWKTKTQISFTVTMKLIRAFVFATWIHCTIPLLPKSEIFKFVAILCCCTAQFVSDLVENTEDLFSSITAQDLSDFHQADLLSHFLV